MVYSGSCELCGGKDIVVKYDFGSHKIYRCRDCTFMWLYPKPSNEELSEVYGFDYYQNEKFFENRNESIYGYYDYLSERYIKQQNYDLLLEGLVRLIPEGGAKGRKFLDMGCGLGYLLDVAFDKGFDVTGIEYNRSASDKINRKFKFQVYCGDLMDYEGGPFDAVAMLDVIEHLTQPFESIHKIASLLKKDGILMLSTMDCDSLVSRVMGKRLEDFRRIREHLYFFTRPTIRTILEREGFEILRIDSYGIPIQMEFLSRRIKLASSMLGAVFTGFVKLFHLSSLQFNFDPHTKMIIFARKKG